MKKSIKIILLLSLFIISCEESTEPKEITYSVKYEVRGTANRVSVTIENDNGGTSQFADVSVPWTYNFSSGAYVIASASGTL